MMTLAIGKSDVDVRHTVPVIWEPGRYVMGFIDAEGCEAVEMDWSVGE